MVRKKDISKACWGVTPASTSWVRFEQHALCHQAMNVREKRESEETCLFIIPIAFPNILLVFVQTLEYFLNGSLKRL